MRCMCTMFLASQYAVYKKLNCIVEVEKLFMYKIMFIYQICIKSRYNIKVSEWS